jgi:P-loop containing dynein motor region D4
LTAHAGGSGRKSLAKLATYVAEQKCFTIEISKNYRIIEFREDLKNLYRVAGGQNKPTTFLFDETQIKYETFVEDINNILTSGEVPNLFAKDEIPGLLDEVPLRLPCPRLSTRLLPTQHHACYMSRVMACMVFNSVTGCQDPMHIVRADSISNTCNARPCQARAPVSLYLKGSLL